MAEGAPPTRGLQWPKIFSISCGFWNFGKIVGWRTSWRVVVPSYGKSWNRPWIGSCPFGIGAPPGKSRVRHCAGPHPPNYQPWSRDWEVVGGGRRIWLGYMRCMKVIDHNHGNRCDGCYSYQHEHSLHADPSQLCRNISVNIWLVINGLKLILKLAMLTWSVHSVHC